MRWPWQIGAALGAPPPPENVRPAPEGGATVSTMFSFIAHMLAKLSDDELRLSAIVPFERERTLPPPTGEDDAALAAIGLVRRQLSKVDGMLSEAERVLKSRLWPSEGKDKA